VTSIASDRELAGRLFPGFPIERFEPIEGGWTVATYEVNEGWILQLPRSDGSAELLRSQIQILPQLARELSAPVPLPERASSDPPAMLYRKLEGMPADRAPDGIWPERLGRSLYDLHLVPPEVVGLRPVPPGAIRDRLRERVTRLSGAVRPLLSAEEAGRADELVRAFLDDDRMWTFATCLIHGDLAAEHILVGEGGDLAGILDWEELGIGDPASDFAWVLEATPDQGERALAAYGGAPDAAFRERARFLAALIPWDDVEHHGARPGPSLERALDEVRARLP
jgi:aminoglycoside phosphotransferase (APT) family kinase protein